MLVKFLRVFRLDRLLEPLMPLLAALAALVVGAVVLLLLDVNPIDAYKALYEGAFGTKNAFAETLVKATPLLLVGIGICISFRAGVINIGGEGQMVIGALMGTALALQIPDAPAQVIIPLSLIVGFIGGAVWGALAGALKAYFKVNEILSTVMLNQIAIYTMNYLLNNTLIDPGQAQLASRIPQTARLSRASDLPRLWMPTRLHLGVVIAVVLAVLVYILLWRTTLGYRIRAVGKSPRASRYAGINVKRYIVLSLLLSGGFAGLAGITQVLGVSHRMITDGSASGFTGSAGFNGIVAALFGKLHPIGAIPASILFGALLVGANQLQRTTQVPSAFVTTLNGIVLFCVVGSDMWTRRGARRRVTVVSAEATTPARQASVEVEPAK